MIHVLLSNLATIVGKASSGATGDCPGNRQLSNGSIDRYRKQDKEEIYPLHQC
jgi:hypothetical protein